MAPPSVPPPPANRHRHRHRTNAREPQLQDAVLHAQETSNAFNDQVLSEHEIFRATKRHEMKALLGAFADGQIRMHKQSAAAWDRSVPSLSQFQSLTLFSLDLPPPLSLRAAVKEDGRGGAMNGSKEDPQND